MVCFPSTVSIPKARRLTYGCESLWELVEQYDLDLDETLTTHVFGLGIDDEISYFDESPATPVQHWTHRDDQNTLTSVTDSTGAIEERYEYGDYGQVTILDPIGVVRTGTDVKARHFYTGRPMIAGTGLADFRYRMMDPVTGRFV